MAGEGRASGKIVLFGEHAVVHGVSALAASIGKGAWAKARVADALSLDLSSCVVDASEHWTIDADSELFRAFRVLCDEVGIKASAHAHIDIPTRAGLGSSACLGVALTRALLSLRGKPFSDADVAKVAAVWEQVFHGNPSGIDVAVATYGGCIEFSKSEGAKLVRLASPIPLCVGDTGTRSSTREMVLMVGDVLRQRANGGKDVLDGIGDCVRLARGALERSDWDVVARAMNDNQDWLGLLGLNTWESDELCKVALSAGALSAKITGAGGGGCVIALAPGRQDDVMRAWRGAGYWGFVVNVGE